MSRIAMKAPRMPPPTAIQSRSDALRAAALAGNARWVIAAPAVGASGLRRPPAAGSAVRVDRRGDRQARAAAAPASGSSGSSSDLHRHALHDLGEVAGRVLRRQQRELRAGARREALDRAGIVMAGKAVDVDRRPAGPASCRPSLRLLEVGDQIDVASHRHDGQTRAGLHELADATVRSPTTPSIGARSWFARG